VQARIDTGAVVVDKGNLDKPETKAIVAPDLAPWLGK